MTTIDLLRGWLANPVVTRMAILLGGLLAIGLLVRLLQRSLPRYLREADSRYRARKFVNFIGYLAAMILALTVFSDQLGGLSVAFGVAGAGIAFALQEVIVSVAGWVAVSFGHFYRSGDRVELGGIMGDVMDIDILRTTLMECGQWVQGDNYNGRIVRVANSSVFKEPVFNYSAEFPFLWDEIKIPVKYGSEVRLARDILQTIADEAVGDHIDAAAKAWERLVQLYMLEDACTSPTVTLVANDNWMEFTVRYVVGYRKRRSTKDQLFTRMLEEFERTGGRVSLASATFQLVETPVLDVRLTDTRTGKR